MVCSWCVGGVSCTKSQEIIMPEASTKKRVWKQEPILHGSFVPTFKNDVSPTRNHCFHECQQVVENHEMGLKGWIFCYESADFGGTRRRDGGVEVAWRWRGGGVEVMCECCVNLIPKMACIFWFYHQNSNDVRTTGFSKSFQYHRNNNAVTEKRKARRSWWSPFPEDMISRGCFQGEDHLKW